MTIKFIDILNVLVFDEPGIHLDFCDGVNVLIGENGVGKTSILKMIYAATQWSIEKNNSGKSKSLLDFFVNNLKNEEVLKHSDHKREESFYRISDGVHSFEYNLSQKEVLHGSDWLGLNIQSVFIPTTEMLSHSKGFLAMNQKYTMPFDGTQIDIIVNASLPETREIPENMKQILEKISNVIDGTVILEDDCFYVVKKDGKRVEFSLEAEGLRKLALLWKLIRNGLLERGSVLLWDEPEANINPELYPLVAEILLELEKNGVQIFVATHSYNFAKYLEIRRTDMSQVIFHNLYKTCEGVSEATVHSQSAYRMEDIQQNHIMYADSQLLDEVYGL